MRKHKLGIYEKALPKNISWQDRLSIAKTCGFDFVEISIDETDERLARLDWSKEERRFPFGSHDEATRQKAYEVMEKAIQLAVDLGIRTIQLAGYDVYYEEQDEGTLARFQEGLEWAVELAASNQVTIAVEIMDTQFMSSISRWKKWDEIIDSPWFTVYPDLGNLSAWNDNVAEELKLGINKISAIHLKDTYKVTETCKGQFRDVPFGDGCVDFPACFNTLAALNYRGAFLIEMWTEKAEEPIAEIINARRWIEQKMKEGGFEL